MSAVLPRTRSFHRARPMRLWWLAVAAALLANLAVIVGLSQASRVAAAVAEPPAVVRSLHRVAPPSPPTALQGAATPATRVAATPVAPPPLPSLELPEIGLPAPLATSTPDILGPLAVPALAMPAFVAGSPLAVAGPAPAWDTAPELDGAFDLDRFYPRSARQRGITGSTRLRLAIAADGRVTGVEVLASTPAGVFDQAAERLAGSLRFHPASAGGHPVPAVHETVIAWTIR